MDHYSILDRTHLDRTSIKPANPAIVSGATAIRTPASTISTQIAAANAKLTDLPKNDLPKNDLLKSALPKSVSLDATTPRFPGEDSGRSLAELAQSDLDAALQLLAERALYITGAAGAAIALRRDQHNDMLCRASVGENAPELGSLLSMEYGLSGESVRSRQPLRCDDASRDPRVNQDACRELGIASVVVMPIASDKGILGIFELFSSQPNAFSERDLSALLRLSQMVELAARHASPAALLPNGETEKIALEPPAPEAGPPNLATWPAQRLAEKVEENIETSSPSSSTGQAAAQPAQLLGEKISPSPAPKPLFWSAAARIRPDKKVSAAENTNAVPPALRNLQKCQACGFPVSQGRTFCVECEEKKWRGQRVSPASSATQVSSQAAASQSQSAPVEIMATSVAEKKVSPSISVAAQAQPVAGTELLASANPVVVPLSAASSQPPPEIPTEGAAVPDLSAAFLSSALPTESWLSSNRYILLALVIVAAIVGMIGWLH